MKILRIVKKDEKNVVLYFDNNEKLYLSYEVFLKSGLRKNDDIPEDRFSFLVNENKIYFLKQKAFRYLGRRLHSAYEIKLKLKQKNYDNDLIDSIIEELKISNYINDYDFAKMFAEENIKNKFWGRRKVESELFKRGIERETILQVLSEKFSGENEINKALELGKKKLKTLLNRNLGDDKVMSKLISFLITRGYDYETSRRTAEALVNKNPDDF